MLLIGSLYKKYQLYREVKITEEEFVPFVVFFPTLIIIISDGIIDKDEWEYVKQLSRFMAKSFKEEHDEDELPELSRAYLLEISYMIKHIKFWESDFIEALKDYINHNPSVKASISDTIHLFAEASEGTSDVEQHKLNYLNEVLELQI
jgi:hypothetical protein